MIEKEYYRLEDLKHRFNMTEADVLYLLEQRSVKASFYTDSTHFVIGGWNKEGFIGYAHVNYRGLISLPERELQDLLRTRKTTPLDYMLPNNQNIQLSSTEYGLELATPNNYIQAWKPKTPAEISWDFIPARLGPHVAETFVYGMQKALDMLLETRTKKNVVSPQFEKYRDVPKQKLTYYSKTFSFSDICIRHEELVSAGVISRPDTPIPPKPEKDAIKLDNEFEDLLAAIILGSPQKLTAKKIHRILCDECEREEDSRLFDKNNILLSEDQGVITWRDKYRNNKERSYLQASLDNVISTVRSKIGKG